MAQLPEYDDDTLMQLQAAGKLSPSTVAAIQANRAPASVPAEGGDDSGPGKQFTAVVPPLGAKQDQYKQQIQQFDSPAGQDSLTDPAGYTTPAQPGIWDTIKGAWDKQLANHFGIPSASAEEPARTPSAAADSPSGPAKVDVSQLAIAQPQGGSSSAVPPIMGQDYIKGINDAFGQEASAIQNLSGAQADAAKNMAGIYERSANEQTDYNDAMAGSYNDLKDITQKHLAEIDELGKKIAATQQIDPNRYWHNMTTGQKIGNAIAIALGGFGMGYAGKQGNPVLDQINRYVDLDINAQKENFERLRGQMGDKINLYGLARQQGLDQVTAVQAARSAALSRAQMEIQAQMARSQAPEVIARGQMMLADLNKQKTMTNLDLAQRVFQMNALRAATMGGGVENPAFLPDEMQKKAVKMPNGLYRTANSEDGAKAVATASLAGDEMKGLLKQMYDLQQSAGRSLPYSQAAAQAKGLMSKIIFKNQKMEGINRLSDTDVKLLEDQIGDPTAFMQGRATALLNQMYQNVDNEQEAVRKQYIPGYVPMRKVAK